LTRARASVLAATLLLPACTGQMSGPSVNSQAGSSRTSSSTNAVPAAPQKKADWATFGFDLQRVGFNPNESVIGVDNAATLHQRWRADLGGPSVTAPVVAKDVEVAGAIADLVYVGSESGDFFALRAASGDVVWQREVGSVQTKCEEFPGGLHGVSGSPTLDRSAGLVYVAGGTGKVFALGLATGKVAKGWPVTITTEPEKDHVYGALALRGHLLYATTAGICEPVPFRGTLIAIDVRRARVVATFHPTGGGSVGVASGDRGVCRSTRLETSSLRPGTLESIRSTLDSANRWFG
jgi:outer membrane protein assembly factor BamB